MWMAYWSSVSSKSSSKQSITEEVLVTYVEYLIDNMNSTKVNPRRNSLIQQQLALCVYTAHARARQIAIRGDVR